ncbi:MULTISPECIES: LLM class F420-dependent oxidoreductase [Nocardioides]|uniref:LLM class F420-dependent oxidoreductase n=1 Tax=Nocardioides vastitatis TaxID=2568655 RepID=A0ABW0ZMZ6_9ACTN|nr:LLM class F420-dependent oxidoreductase [Nocardioides sp.]THI92758.1 LLM class F420-dependent oxidoreductase [Nocardioides sp.]
MTSSPLHAPAPVPDPGDRWGVSLPFTDEPLVTQIDQYRQLADEGCTDFWTLEARGWDAFTPLAMAATTLSDVHVGTAIVPVFTRGAATLAGHAAAMAELYGDRFTLGLGASTPPIVQNWNGQSYEDPYHRIKDTVRFLKAALAGEKVTENYRTFSVRGFQLERPPAHPPKMLLAALRPGMLKLAGSETDGALLSWASVDDVPRIQEIAGSHACLGARLFVCPSTDRDHVLATARRQIAWYATTPAYRAFHEWAGRTEPLARMWHHWEAGDRRVAVDSIPEGVVDELVVSGSPEQCVEHLDRYRAAGIQIPIIHLIASGTSTFAAALSLTKARARSSRP